MKKLVDFLVKLTLAKFYGEIVIKMENGVVVHVKETKSYSREHFS